MYPFLFFCFSFFLFIFSFYSNKIWGCICLLGFAIPTIVVLRLRWLIRFTLFNTFAFDPIVNMFFSFYHSQVLRISSPPTLGSRQLGSSLMDGPDIPTTIKYFPYISPILYPLIGHASPSPSTPSTPSPPLPRVHSLPPSHSYCVLFFSFFSFSDCGHSGKWRLWLLICQQSTQWGNRWLLSRFGSFVICLYLH